MNNLKNQMQTTNAQASTPTMQGQDVGNGNPFGTVASYLEKIKPQLERALPRTNVSVDRFTRIALTSIRSNPMLLNADIHSLLGAVMQSAQLGLEPNLLGSCYLVPYKDRKKGITTVNFQIGYKGLIDLVTRTGEVLSIKANAVHENDLFHYEFGVNEDLKHIPAQKDRGEITHFYAYAKMKSGIVIFEVMSIEEINAIRDKHSTSFNYQKGASIWAQHYEAMAKKTVIKQLVKYMPISVDTQSKLANDETTRFGIENEPQRVIYEVEEVEENPPHVSAQENDIEILDENGNEIK